MDCSVVAIKTDVKIDGKNVVGYGFRSNGRYSVSELLKKRFLPRIKEAEEKDLSRIQPDVRRPDVFQLLQWSLIPALKQVEESSDFPK